MSKLDELIASLCSDGVPYKKISSIATISRGKRVVKEQLSQEMGYAVYQNSLVSMGYHKEANFPANTTFIIGAGAAGEVGYSVEPFWAADDCFPIIGNEVVLDRYIYHVMMWKKKYLKSKVRKASIPRLSRSVIESLVIPVPPVEAQSEIVRILDNFIELTEELTTVLAIELKARKKQYQYYLNHYYERQSENLIPLGSIGSFTRGKRFVHADATSKGVPCIHYGELYTFYGVHADSIRSHIREELRPKMRYAHNGDVIIVGAGENNIDIGVGVAWEGNYDVAVHDACYIFHHDQNPKYISYFLRSDMYHTQIKKYVSEGKICSISAIGLGKALIPIPAIEEQNRIVEILEKFDALCQDIAAAIGEEIEVRKKQYEYYREKILNFEED